MKRHSILFLQFVLLLVGFGSLFLLLWGPHLEGRNVNATVFEIYFQDPFLAYVYFASLFFFTALYQAFKVLNHVRHNKPFAPENVKAFRIIKHCALALIAFILGAEAYIIISMGGKDDIAGGVAMGLFLLFGSVVVATAATVFEKTVQSAVELKSENDLTV